MVIKKTISQVVYEKIKMLVDNSGEDNKKLNLRLMDGLEHCCIDYIYQPCKIATIEVSIYFEYEHIFISLWRIGRKTTQLTTTISDFKTFEIKEDTIIINGVSLDF